MNRPEPHYVVEESYQWYCEFMGQPPIGNPVYATSPAVAEWAWMVPSGSTTCGTLRWFGAPEQYQVVPRLDEMSAPRVSGATRKLQLKSAWQSPAPLASAEATIGTCHVITPERPSRMIRCEPLLVQYVASRGSASQIEVVTSSPRPSLTSS